MVTAITLRVQAQAETQAYVERVKAAEALQQNPALLRLAELETLRELAQNANARLYLDFSGHAAALDGAQWKESPSNSRTDGDQ